VIEREEGAVDMLSLYHRLGEESRYRELAGYKDKRVI
jgi:hypothetical protein